MTARPRRGEASAGITLIELLIAVVIVGIIAAFATPNYLSHVQNARAERAMQLLEEIAIRQEIYKAANGKYAQDLGGLGYTDLNIGTYTVNTVTQEGCSIDADCLALRAKAEDGASVKWQEIELWLNGLRRKCAAPCGDADWVGWDAQ